MTQMIFLQAKQRIYEWHGLFGKRALALQHQFFSDPKHEGKYESNEAQKAYASEALKDAHFVWKDTSNPQVDTY